MLHGHNALIIMSSGLFLIFQTWMNVDYSVLIDLAVVIMPTV